MKLEDKLAALADCGITLGPQFTVQDLLDREDGDREHMDDTDLLMFLYIIGLRNVVLGDSDEPCGSLSPQVHTFDTECIEGPGSYAPLLTELAAMTQGALVLGDIDDQVDFAQERAQLSFTCSGQRVTVAFDQDGDWFAPRVLDSLAALLNGSGSPLRFFAMDSGDQCAMTGCLLPEQIKQLNTLGVPTTIYNQTFPLDGCTVTPV